MTYLANAGNFCSLKAAALPASLVSEKLENSVG